MSRRQRCAAVEPPPTTKRYRSEQRATGAASAAPNSSIALAQLRRIARRLRKPLVVDADGLNACAEYKDIFFSRSEETILTPHVGEFAYLSGFSKQDILAQPIEISRQFAVENGYLHRRRGGHEFVLELLTCTKSSYIISFGWRKHVATCLVC